MTPRLSVLADGLDFPEGPAFDAAGDLWCVEMRAGRLARRRQDGRLERFEVGGAPNGVAIDTADGVWFCDADQGAIRRLDPASGRCETAVDTVDGRPLDRPNDLAFDAAGNLVFTCPGNSRTEPTGYVCALTPHGESKIVADGLYFPNGLAFAPAGDLILAETRRQRLWRGGWDAAARQWLTPGPFCQTAGAPIGPDGLALDDQGRIYAAIYGAGLVQIFEPDGTRVGLLATLGTNTSNCAFDPSGKLGLVITETERGQILGFDLAARGARVFAGQPPVHFSGKPAHVR
jgi:gluconolactonase